MPEERSWLLMARKLAHEASPQELKELEALLRAHPELHFKLQTLEQVWQTGTSTHDPAIDDAYSRLSGKLVFDVPSDQDVNIPEEDPLPEGIITITPRRSVYSRYSLIAAVIIGLVSCLALYYLFPASRAVVPQKNEISTRYGSKTNIRLPDGSIVWLNAGSKLIYDKNFGEKVREVQLTGEAFFDVAHNPVKPFIIHTLAMDIKVLGTSFNVKSYPEDRTAETSLLRGSIEVTLKDNRAGKIILKPNEKLVVANPRPLPAPSTPSAVSTSRQEPAISVGSVNYSSIDSMILETSWIDNRLVFEDESFEEIALRMTRWYGMEFFFENDEVRHWRFTGNFSNETINEALSAMQITAEFDFSIHDRKVTITKQKPPLANEE